MQKKCASAVALHAHKGTVAVLSLTVVGLIALGTANAIMKNTAVQDVTANPPLSAEPLSFDKTGLDVTVYRETAPSSLRAADLKAQAQKCRTRRPEEYFDALADSFKTSKERIYTFQQNKLTGDGGVFRVRLLPNRPGYATLESFQKDFAICAVGGDKPAAFNKDWLMFVQTSCGHTVTPPILECEQIMKVVLPSLTLR